jgi:hypothetical protein
MTAEAPIYTPQDCYGFAQIARRIVPRLDLATLKGQRRAAQFLLYARQQKGLPHVSFGPRSIMYPRALVHEWLLARQTNCQQSA